MTSVNVVVGVLRNEALLQCVNITEITAARIFVRNRHELLSTGPEYDKGVQISEVAGCLRINYIF